MTDDELDRWRTVADDPADRAVAGFFETAGHHEPAALVGELVGHLRLPPEDLVPSIAEFLHTAGKLPSWADDQRMARGQSFFSQFGLHQFTALYLASLPSAYAAAKGVHVLWLTARLETDAERRLNETAQFLMDVTEPGAFDPGGAAIDRILHVRLMHAAVRWLIDHDPRVNRPADADPGAAPAAPTWAASWGRPVNQEDLAGTMLTFTTVVFDAFRRGGVEFVEADAEDYFELWRVIGSLLGVADGILPADLAAGRALQDQIFRRQHAPSVVGSDLTATLLGLAKSRMPRPLAALAPALVRRYIGNDVADMISVPPSGPARFVLAVMIAFTRVFTRARESDPFPGWLAEHIGRRLLQGVLEADRKGERVPFAIPDRLGGLG
jgi:hypothetical protein